MRFGKRKHLEAFVLGLIPIADRYALGTKLCLKLREDGCLQAGDMGGIPQRSLRLGLDFWIAEFAGSLVAFAPITRLTRHRQIRCPTPTASAPGGQVLNLEGDTLCMAVDACSIPLLKQVFPQQIPLQLALLVLCSVNVRVVHFLRVETRYFNVDLAYGQEGSYQVYSFDRRFRFRAKRRREPAAFAPTIGKPGWPVSSFAASPIAAILASLGQLEAYVGAQMHLGLVDHLPIGDGSDSHCF